MSIKDIVHERAWVRANAFAVGVRILAETRNRKHSKELFKLMREAYGEVEILGYYDSPEDYVAGNLHSTKFEAVEEESPFDGGMNIQYNVDRCTLAGPCYFSKLFLNSTSFTSRPEHS